MTTIPAKVQSRLTSGLKKFQSIVNSAKAREVLEGKIADDAKRRINKALKSITKEITSKTENIT